jgi:protein-glucosylgalactosylhydroxylysine glucosidase
MPAVANGHIATNVFSDTVNMNGLYNGKGGESKRARIPGYANIRMSSSSSKHPFKPIYSMDTREGAFKVHVNRDRFTITQRVFAHRFYTRTIVNQIVINSRARDGKFSKFPRWAFAIVRFVGVLSILFFG